MNNNDAMNGILYIVGHIPVSKRVTISTYLSGEFVALFTIITKAIFRCKRKREIEREIVQFSVS